MKEPAKKKRFFNKKAFNQYVPITSWLPSYKKQYIMSDLIAAVTVIFILIPQALGYAQMAGVPPEVGLYTIPLPLIAYAIFGTSRHISVGPSSATAILSFSIISALTVGDPERFLALTSIFQILHKGYRKLLQGQKLGQEIFQGLQQ